MIDFCHIVPTPHLDLVKRREVHLVLAHLIEEDEAYRDFYNKSGAMLIMDNSAFEMYKREQPMYPTEKLIDMANKVGASYVVMSDYPGEPIKRTMDAAVDMIPKLKEAGFGTFFCPQSEEGDIEGLIAAYGWAFYNPDIDYIAFSILNIPIAYGCERGQVDKPWRMQRFLSRWMFMKELSRRFDLQKIHKSGKKFHLLGMTEGPNEIQLMSDFADIIDTWDSSAAVWAGLNGDSFDQSPTGMRNGKFEKEVDFNFKLRDADAKNMDYAISNMKYIDSLCNGRWYS